MKDINKIYMSTDGIFIKITKETDKILYGFPLQTTHEIKKNDETNTININLCPLLKKAETFEVDYIYLYKNKNGTIVGKSREWHLYEGEIFKEHPQNIEEYLKENI